MTTTAFVSKKDPNRYKPRHLWYLSEAQDLVRQLQQKMWPLGFHLAIGGGVLNHGYSDNDLDLYVLPVYREGVGDELDAVNALVKFFGGDTDFEPEEVCSTRDTDHECYRYQIRVRHEGRPVEIFFVRRNFTSAD